MNRQHGTLHMDTLAAEIPWRQRRIFHRSAPIYTGTSDRLPRGRSSSQLVSE